MTNAQITTMLAEAPGIVARAEAKGWIKRHYANAGTQIPIKGVRRFTKAHKYNVATGVRKGHAARLKALAATIALCALQSFGAIDDSKAIRAIVGEAANQGRSGMLAVAGAIRNRGSLKGVYGVKNPAADKQPAWVWQRAREAWASSATNDITKSATHWENTKAFGRPYWAASLTVTTNIGAHTFYR
jgi:hypothetical protein